MLQITGVIRPHGQPVTKLALLTSPPILARPIAGCNEHKRATGTLFRRNRSQAGSVVPICLVSGISCSSKLPSRGPAWNPGRLSIRLHVAIQAMSFSVLMSWKVCVCDSYARRMHQLPEQHSQPEAAFNTVGPLVNLVSSNIEDGRSVSICDQLLATKFSRSPINLSLQI